MVGLIQGGKARLQTAAGGGIDGQIGPVLGRVLLMPLQLLLQGGVGLLIAHFSVKSVVHLAIGFHPIAQALIARLFGSSGADGASDKARAGAKHRQAQDSQYKRKNPCQCGVFHVRSSESITMLTTFPNRYYTAKFPSCVNKI